MYIEGTQFADSQTGSGSTSTQGKVTTTVAYFIIFIEDKSPLRNISTFRNTILLATCLGLWSDKQWEETPEKKRERKWVENGIRFPTQDLVTAWNNNESYMLHFALCFCCLVASL